MLAPDFVAQLLEAEPATCWQLIADRALQLYSAPLEKTRVAEQLVAREREFQALDLFLANTAWDLWEGLENHFPSNAEALVAWWNSKPGGRAVLILDGLSLREIPWLVQQAEAQGMRLTGQSVHRSELPPDTTHFARALGVPNRSQFENNKNEKHRLPGARTDTSNLPFQDCVGSITSHPDWLFWHHWPDHRAHELDQPAKGLSSLAAEVADQLSSQGFWDLVRRLAQGRRLLITSDHGYAAAGYFPTPDQAQANYLKERFKSGRHSQPALPPSPFVPPTDLAVTSRWGQYQYVLGQLRWKSQGGYPTLTHGGLTLLEVLCPFLELERTDHG